MVKLPEVTQATDVAGVLLNGYLAAINQKKKKKKKKEIMVQLSHPFAKSKLEKLSRAFSSSLENITLS